MIPPEDLDERSLQTDLHIQASYRLTEALVASEKRMRRRIELISEVVFEIDSQGSFTFLNPAWTAILGYGVEGSIRKRLIDFVVEEDRARCQRQLDHCGSILEGICEVRLLSQSGKAVSMELSTTPIEEGGWIGTLYNVTQRNEARAELARLSLVASYTDSLVVITDAQGCIEWVNRAFEKRTGFTLQECLGRKPGAFLQGANTDPETISHLRDSIARGQSFHCEILNYTKTGQSYWVAIFGTPIYDGQGRLERFVAVENDITTLRQMQHDLSVAKDAAEKASQAKTVFLAAMSHEIRTPLNGVLGMASLLAEGHLEPQQRERADIIKKSGEALVTIVNDILDYSKIEAGRFSLASEIFTTKSILDDAVDLFKGNAKTSGVHLIERYEGDPNIRVRGDRGRLLQVTMNLVSNALKFTAEGEVRTEMRVESTGETAAITVTIIDTGIGIATADIARLFIHFSQLDDSVARKAGGTGLGLAISKQLIEMMGGHIGVESELGKGSKFWFKLTLPIVRGEVPVREVATGGTALDLNGRSILVAEDNIVNQMVLEGMLATLGCHVDIAENGKVAVAMVAKKAYDLILMDVQMPEMDGLEASRIIRLTSSIPIIAVTANVLPEHIAMCRSCGMDGFVPKPVTRESVEAEILSVFSGPSLLPIASNA
jgi:PAS domain S-box-containing protein